MTTWGPAQADSTNAFRIGYDVAYSGLGTSSATVSVTLRLGTRYFANDSSVSWSIGGSFSPGSGSRSFDHNSSSEWSPSNVTVLGTVTRTVTPSYSAAVSGSTTASVTGLAAVAGTASVTVNWSVPKRAIGAPAAPTGCDHTRISDTQHTVTWSNTSPTNVAAPYQNIDVERQTNDGAWARIATVGVVTSYTDKTTVANRKYCYRVRAKNSAGASGYSTDAVFATTPAAPTNVTAKKSGGSIVVTWTDMSPYNTGFQLWHAANGVWDGSPLATLGNVSTYTHPAPSTAVTHTYRLKSTTSSPVLASAYSTASGVVQLLAAPLAPTPILPVPAAADADNDITLTWLHRPVDTTDQTKFEVQHRLAGGSTWTSSGTVVSDVSQWSLPGGTYANGGTLEWQVRTWGDFTTASPWSPTSVLTLSSAPTVLINSPDGITPWGSSQLTVTWGYNDNEANPQAAYRATLYNATGDVVEVRTASGAADIAAFSTAVEDGGSYSVGVAAQDSTGIWSAEDVVAFTVTYAPPPTPVVVAQWLPDTGAVSITVTNPETISPNVDAVTNRIWRSINGQDWALVADNVELNSSVTDFIPGLGSVNYYRAQAISALPSVAESVVVEVVTGEAGAVWVNAGPGFSQSIRVTSNVQVGITFGRARRERRAAGRDYPVPHDGNQLTKTITVSALIWNPRTMPDRAATAATWDEIEAFAALPSPACYRDPEGQRVFVSMSPVQLSDIIAAARTASWTLSGSDYREVTEDEA